MNHMLILVGVLLVFSSCETKSKGQKIVDRAIEKHGGKAYEEVRISFDFREIHYEILKTPERYEYSRVFEDSLGRVKDILNNEGFRRFINGAEVQVTEERTQAFSNSVNSVAYFAFLPYGLNDMAAQKEWIRETELEGNRYDVIYVNFVEEGGGDDFDDEFLYWINKETGRMDYLAYTFHTEGGGVRFRKAVNQRVIDGVLIQDYENYMPAGAEKRPPLDKVEHLYTSGGFELLSEIQMKNVEVERL